MDLLRALGTFVRIVDAGSFSAVAREMRESHSAVTRLVNQLEAHFGVRLLHRTTRRLSLTEDGRDLLDHARHMLEVADGMEAALGRQRCSPTGLVRVGTAVALAQALTRRMPVLFERYPGLSVELVAGDRVADMIEERLDVGIWRGPIGDASLVTRQVGSFFRPLVASPDYLARRGVPAVPADLLAHDCIVNTSWTGAREWRLTGPDGVVDLRVSGPLAANNSDDVRLAARAGLGIAMLPDLHARDDLASGQLVRVLSAYASERMPLVLAYPSRRFLAPRTRAVIDFIVAEMHALRLAPEADPSRAA